MAIMAKKVIGKVASVAPMVQGKKPVTPVAQVGKKPVTPVATVKKNPQDFEVFDMSNIQLLPKAGGGGKAMSPFATKCLGLEIGQGIKISEEKYNNGKGVASLYAAAKRRGIKFRVRRDVTGQLWLFRIELEIVEEQATEEYEGE